MASNRFKREADDTSLPVARSIVSSNNSLRNVSTNRNMFGFAVQSASKIPKAVYPTSNVSHLNNTSNFNNHSSILPNLYEQVDELLNELELNNPAENGLVYKLSTQKQPLEMFVLYELAFNAIPQNELSLAKNVNRHNAILNNVNEINKQLQTYGLMDDDGNVLQLDFFSNQALTDKTMRRWLEVLLRVIREIAIPWRALMKEHEALVAPSKPDESITTTLTAEELINSVQLGLKEPDQQTFKVFLQMQRLQEQSLQTDPDFFSTALKKRLQRETEETTRQTKELQREREAAAKEVRQLELQVAKANARLAQLENERLLIVDQQNKGLMEQYEQLNYALRDRQVYETHLKPIVALFWGHISELEKVKERLIKEGNNDDNNNNNSIVQEHDEEITRMKELVDFIKKAHPVNDYDAICARLNAEGEVWKMRRQN